MTEQGQKLAAVKTLPQLIDYAFDRVTGKLRDEVLNDMSKKDYAEIQRNIQGINAETTGPTTNPTTEPVTPAAPVLPKQLLPTKLQQGFELTGTQTIEWPMDVVQGQRYLVVLEVTKLTDGGGNTQFVRPSDHWGQCYKPLVLGKNEIPMLIEKTGLFLWSVIANGGNVTVSNASLTAA